MADFAVEVEARINDQVTNALKSMQAEMRRLEHTSFESFKKMGAQIDTLDKKTKGGTDAIAGHLKKLGGAVLAATAGFFAFSKIKGILEESTQAAREQVIADKDLQATLQSTGHIAGVTFEELTKMASGLQRVTNFQDDAIQRAQGMLLTFTKIGKEVFPQATEMTLNLAQKFKTDAAGAAVQLGKALQDPILGLTALRRVGIQYSATQQQQIKDFVAQNNILGAQKVIMAELETQFGGLARKTADPMTMFTNAIGDAKETLGMALLPALNDVATKTTEWLSKAQEAGHLEAIFDAVAASANAIASGINNIVIATGNWLEKESGQVKLLAIYEELRRSDPMALPVDLMERAKQVMQERKEILEDAKKLKEQEDASGFAFRGSAKTGPKSAQASSGPSAEQIKEAEEMAKFEDATATNRLKRSIEHDNKQAKFREDLRAKVRAAHDQEEKEARQAALQLAKAEAGDDKLKLLEIEHAQQLSAVADNERAISSLKKSHLLERQKLEKEIKKQSIKDEEADANLRRDIAFTAAGNIVQAGQMMFSHSKKNAAILKTLAIFEIGINTTRAIMAALANPPGPPLSLALAGSIGLLGAAQMAKATQQKFAMGTLAAPGGRALVGERGPEIVELPVGSRVFNNTESRQMMGGGITHRGDVIIQMPAIPGMTLEQSAAIGRGAAKSYHDELKHLARMNRDIEYRGITG